MATAMRLSSADLEALRAKIARLCACLDGTHHRVDDGRSAQSPSGSQQETGQEEQRKLRRRTSGADGGAPDTGTEAGLRATPPEQAQALADAHALLREAQQAADAARAEAGALAAALEQAKQQNGRLEEELHRRTQELNEAATCVSQFGRIRGEVDNAVRAAHAELVAQQELFREMQALAAEYEGRYAAAKDDFLLCASAIDTTKEERGAQEARMYGLQTHVRGLQDALISQTARAQELEGALEAQRAAVTELRTGRLALLEEKSALIDRLAHGERITAALTKEHKRVAALGAILSDTKGSPGKKNTPPLPGVTDY